MERTRIACKLEASISALNNVYLPYSLVHINLSPHGIPFRRIDLGVRDHRCVQLFQVNAKRLRLVRIRNREVSDDIVRT